MAFIKPSISLPVNERPTSNFFVEDLEGRLYHIKSVKRFCELTGIPSTYLYKLVRKESKKARGLTLYEGDLYGKQIIVVDANTPE